MLSRLPAGRDEFFDNQQSLNLDANQIQDSQVRDLPVPAIEAQKVTKADPVLQKLYLCIKNGWPQAKKKLD